MSEPIGTVIQPPKAGDRLGNWTLVARHGRGGNGEVWKASQCGKTDSAIKLLTKPKAVAYGRFCDEIKVMSECGVAGVVPVSDHYFPNDYLKERAWYVMPLGTPLLTLLKDAALSSIVASIADIAQTLGELHSRGIFHRDIKPENLLSIAGVSSIGDFGLVVYPEKKNLTNVKERLGPRWTMAPEVVRQGSAAEPAKADVFSLAKTLWILITGNTQGFDGQYASNSTASIEAYAGASFIEPLEAIMSAATDHTPANRPVMSEFAIQLRNWLEIDSDYHARNPLAWEHLQRRLFPISTPLRAVWTDSLEMVKLLDLLGGRSDMNHMFLPGGGGLDLSGACFSEREEGCIELEFGGVNHLLKPHRLMFESFGYEPQWNYFRLEADELQPSGTYEQYSEKYAHEELTDLGEDGYIDRGYWDEGEYRGERLPPNARVIVRHFRGAFVIFEKTSRYNQVPGTYDGRHNKMDADAFRAYIDKVVSKLKQRDEDDIRVDGRGQRPVVGD
jgi:serine/threonine protein kinase